MEVIKNGVKILYEDEDILVCVKPAGIASQTKRAGQQDMVSLLRNYRNEKGEEPYLGLVHRLDQPVEGILVFGKHAKSTAELNRQLTQGDFVKVYLAVTEGNMPRQEGKLQDYLKKDGRSNRSVAAEKGDPQAKRAELLYWTLETDDSQEPKENLVRIRLLTGRRHQIRAQMALLGTPLVGDRKYGAQTAYFGKTAEGDMEKCDSTGRRRNGAEDGLGLCVCELEFTHPVKKKSMKFSIVPSQAVFQKFAGRLSEMTVPESSGTEIRS